MSYWSKISLSFTCEVSKADKIHEAVQEFWDFADITTNMIPDKDGYANVYISGEDRSSHSCFDETLEEIVHAVWKVNGAYCDVGVQSLYLEELPWEDHLFNEEDYANFTKEDKACEQ